MNKVIAMLGFPLIKQAFKTAECRDFWVLEEEEFQNFMSCSWRHLHLSNPQDYEALASPCSQRWCHNSSSWVWANSFILLCVCFWVEQVVETLLKAGAQTETRNKSGNTALQLASLKGNINIARMLLESGADIHAESNDKGTALDYAAEWGSEEMVDFLSLWAAKAVPR
jgi:ankyrin repeat protein